jgi:dTDP-4-dehydrorhamnose reductase
VGVDWEECDLKTRGNARALIETVRPQAIVNAAAYTAVDRAEAEPEIARVINVDAAQEMAQGAHKQGALLVHYSTDYVFNGCHDRPWTEEDTPDPLNVYGRTKLQGEQAVLNSGAAAFVFRTSWVYGSHGANFLLTMLRLGASREELSIVCDQLGAPTWSRSLAELTLYTIRKFSAEEGTIDLRAASELGGVYHATCGGGTNWFEFACAIFDEARARQLPLKVRHVTPITSEQYPSAAKRPRYSVLSNAKLNQRLGTSLPQWRQALAGVMSEVNLFSLVVPQAP